MFSLYADNQHESEGRVLESKHKVNICDREASGFVTVHPLSDTILWRATNSFKM